MAVWRISFGAEKRTFRLTNAIVALSCVCTRNLSCVQAKIRAAAIKKADGKFDAVKEAAEKEFRGSKAEQEKIKEEQLKEADADCTKGRKKLDDQDALIDELTRAVLASTL